MYILIACPSVPTIHIVFVIIFICRKKQKFLDLAMFSKNMEKFWDSIWIVLGLYFFRDTIWILFWDIEKCKMDHLDRLLGYLILSK